MSNRFTGTILLMNDSDLKVMAGDIFRFDPDHPEYLFKNNHYIKVGVMTYPEQLVEKDNYLSNRLKERAISFYRRYKIPESFSDWQRRERLHPSVAKIIWDYYKISVQKGREK